MNKVQGEAVSAPNGYVQIVAGPGTGKTSTLVNRIVELLSRGIAPERMVIMSFTRAAAREIRDRAAAAIAESSKTKLNKEQNNPKSIVVGTFHSIAAQHLRTYGTPEQRALGVVDDREKGIVISQVLEKVETNALDSHLTGQGFTGSIRAKCSSLLSQIQQHFPITIKPEAHQFATAYFSRMSELKKTDFDGLLVEWLKLINNSIINEHIDAVLIDEFQDTSSLQLEITLKLASKCCNLTVVGDADQSIYEFRNASPVNFRFMRERTKCEVCFLEDNYRSEQPTLDAAYRVITGNPPVKGGDYSVEAADTQAKGRRRLVARRTAHHTPVYFWQDNPTVVAKQVEHLIRCGVHASEICILTRYTNAQQPFEAALMVRNIQSRLVGGKKQLASPEVTACICFIRLALDHNDLLAVTQSLPSTVKVRNSSLNELRMSTRSTIQNYVEFVDSVQRRFRKMYKEGIEGSDIVQKLVEYIVSERFPTSVAGKAIRDALEEFKEVYAEMDDSNTEDEITDFMSTFTRLWALASPNTNAGKDAITISTIHSAKGLEWPVVIVSAWGSLESLKNEEKRVLYVAMTRARSLLIVCGPRLLQNEMKGLIVESHGLFVPDGEALSECVHRKISALPLPKQVAKSRFGTLELPAGFEVPTLATVQTNQPTKRPAPNEMPKNKKQSTISSFFVKSS